MTSVPRFALYGTEQASAWADLVHIERVPERSSRFNWEIDPHVHEALLQLLYVVAASEGGEALIDGRRWPIEPPCLIVVPAGAVHGFHFRSDTDGPVITAAQRPLESLVAAIAPELLAHIRKPVVLSVDPANRFAEGLLPLFEAIDREWRFAGSGQMAAGMSLLAALFVQIARISESPAAPLSDARTRKAAQIEHFRRLVDQRFREERSVESYARELGLSAGHLGRLCRDTLGMSPQEAINARVVHEAQRELVYSSLSVKQVAAVLGFQDEAYFGRFFRKHTGQRPTEFRHVARAHLART
jgi:AraC family transcriptional activator of pobA